MKNKSKEKFIIDRFEGDFAIMEYWDRKNFNLPRQILPINAKVGDVINIEISIEEEETENRKQEIAALAKKLFRE